MASAAINGAYYYFDLSTWNLRLGDAAGPEAALASFGLIERIDHIPYHVFHLLNHKLRDTIAGVDFKKVVRIEINERDLKLPTIMAINEARGIENGNALLDGKAASGLHKACISLRYRDSKTGGNKRTLERSERHMLGSTKIHAGVARIGVRGNSHVIRQAGDIDRKLLRQKTLPPFVKRRQNNS